MKIVPRFTLKTRTRKISECLKIRFGTRSYLSATRVLKNGETAENPLRARQLRRSERIFDNVTPAAPPHRRSITTRSTMTQYGQSIFVSTHIHVFYEYTLYENRPRVLLLLLCRQNGVLSGRVLSGFYAIVCDTTVSFRVLTKRS